MSYTQNTVNYTNKYILYFSMNITSTLCYLA